MTDGPDVTDEQLTTETDVDVLWHGLVAAKADGDAARVRAIEGRMRELSGERRFAHLSDDELQARLDSLAKERVAKDMLSHSPGGGPGGDSNGGVDILKLNVAIRANQHVGIEDTRNALIAEIERRRG